MKTNYKHFFFILLFVWTSSFLYSQYKAQINEAIELGRSQCKNERVTKAKERSRYQVYNYKSQLMEDMKKYWEARA